MSYQPKIKIPFSLQLDPTLAKTEGWVSLTKKKIPKSETKLPWRKGTLLNVRSSPAPSKVPDNSVVMFLDYSCTSYDITDFSLRVNSAETQSIKTGNEKDSDFIQHCVTVLCNEQIVDLFSQELFGVFDEVETVPA